MLQERLAWWAELFEPPCVGYAASLDEVSPLAQAGADFVALGDWIWTHAQGPAAVIAEAAGRLGTTLSSPAKAGEGGPPAGRWRGQAASTLSKPAPSTMLRMVPLPRFAGEDGKYASIMFAAAIIGALASPAAAHNAREKKPQQPAATAAAAPAAAAPDASVRAPDLAYGAFQRGYYLQAFALATARVTQQSDPKSMTLLGELYAAGLGVARNDAKAADWYKLAAERGDPAAMFALGIFSLEGRAGPRDRLAGAKWFAAAAKLGHPLAAYNLALLYMEGQLFPQDFVRAAELLRVAAQAGNPEALYALGTFYKEGRGVPKDISEAVRLWAAAAIADNTDAQVEYAIALYNGDGTAKNEAAAAAWFRKAALKGSAIAQDRLARILATGRGAPTNPVAATKWHKISKARGETDLLLDDFVTNLDPQSRAEGEKEAKVWLDALKHPPL